MADDLPNILLIQADRLQTPGATRIWRPRGDAPSPAPVRRRGSCARTPIAISRPARRRGFKCWPECCRRGCGPSTTARNSPPPRLRWRITCGLPPCGRDLGRSGAGGGGPREPARAPAGPGCARAWPPRPHGMRSSPIRCGRPACGRPTTTTTGRGAVSSRRCPEPTGAYASANSSGRPQASAGAMRMQPGASEAGVMPPWRSASRAASTEATSIRRPR